MFNIFPKKENSASLHSHTNFDYLDPKSFYFDSACQTLRPQQVIDSEIEYYHTHNSCGHRVKYRWGEITDKKVDQCRENILKLVSKSSKDYAVAFTNNTTMGINMVLHQLPKHRFDAIVTSQIEHNSVFLPSLVWSQNNQKPRLLLERDKDGTLIYDKNQLHNAVVLLNSTSNIDGRNLQNAPELAKDTHDQGGIIMLDACQSLAHNPTLLQKTDFDVAFGSGHKMYGPSVGFIIIKKTLLSALEPYLIGGSTVQNVYEDTYELATGEDLYSRIEPGLQNYAGIIGLNTAIEWQMSWKKDGLNTQQYEQILSQKLHDTLTSIPHITLLYDKPSPVVSLYSDRYDGHQLALFLSQVGIMGRSGYHCCHYYLKEHLKLPPLLRISLGLHNTPEDIATLGEKLRTILS